MGLRSSLYEQDFFAWSSEQAALLRAGNLAQADLENIAEEIDSMGRTEKRELVSRLTVLFLHLLKWEFQPDKRCSSLETSVVIQRLQTAAHMADNPSLKHRLPETIDAAYKIAVLEAAQETGLPKSAFLPNCPYNFDQAIADTFWPGEKV